MTFTSWGIEVSFPASTSAPNLREDVNGADIHYPMPRQSIRPNNLTFISIVNMIVDNKMTFVTLKFLFVRREDISE